MMEIRAGNAKPGDFLLSDNTGRGGIIKQVVIPSNERNCVVLMCEQNGGVRGYTFQRTATVNIVKMSKPLLLQ